jgi:membrane protein DedA with SNARE-associated domain
MTAEERRGHLPLIVLGAVAIAGFVAVNQLLPDISLEEILDDVGSRLGSLTYLLVGLAAFLETGAFVGLVLPGETAVILAGAIAGQGETSFVITMGVVWFAAWAGDSVSFLIGTRLGRGFLMRHGPRFRITPERLRSVDRYFKQHGGKTILIGRFIGLVRAIAPFIAGSSGMAYRTFLPFSVLGTGLWAGAFTALGFLASRSLDEAAEVAGQGTLLFGISVAVIAAIVVSVRFLRDSENRARLARGMEGNRMLRPLPALGRRIRPQALFIWRRITPGSLGLEFTALIAILAVGAYVAVALGVVVSDSPGPTPGDNAALDVANSLRTSWLDDLAKVVTELGSAALTLPLAILAAIALASRRRWAEVAALGTAILILYPVVPELKELVDRPRPPDPLVSVDSQSYPSGHAAHAVLYPWLALTVTARLRPGLAGGTALIIAGFAIAVIVGLSRVYLHVHYMSDVWGGWAVGAAVFAACAVAVLLVAHFRQNGRGRAGGGQDRD